jgi:hypothetical protein
MSIHHLKDQLTDHSNSSDADLLTRLRIALSVQRRAGWHLVRFTARHGIVQLTGIVPAYYDRQLIVALVRHVAGVRGIEDHLAVGDPSIRQQVVDDETIALQNHRATTAAAPRDPFLHVPALLQSLDDVLVSSSVSVV